MTATAGTPENLKCFANSDLFEMRVYHTNPDRGDKIYFIHCLLWVSLPETTKSEACRNAICYLFFLSLRVQAADPFVEVRLWKPTANLTQGANADPKRAGQMSAHTPALCRCLPAEMSNTMMWEEAGGELSACHYQVRKPKKFSCEDADSYVWIHGSHRHTCTLIWMTTKWPTNLIQAVTGTITCF